MTTTAAERCITYQRTSHGPNCTLLSATRTVASAVGTQATSFHATTRPLELHDRCAGSSPTTSVARARPCSALEDRRDNHADARIRQTVPPATGEQAPPKVWSGAGRPYSALPLDAVNTWCTANSARAQPRGLLGDHGSERIRSGRDLKEGGGCGARRPLTRRIDPPGARLLPQARGSSVGVLPQRGAEVIRRAPTKNERPQGASRSLSSGESHAKPRRLSPLDRS